MNNAKIKLVGEKVVEIKGDSDSIIELYEYFFLQGKVSSEAPINNLNELILRHSLDSVTASRNYTALAQNESFQEVEHESELEINLNELLFPLILRKSYEDTNKNILIRKFVNEPNRDLIEIKQKNSWDCRDHLCSLSDPSSNKPVIINLNAYLKYHQYDAIHLNAHNITLIFKQNGTIANRNNPGTGNSHPDAIQLIPPYRYAGGELHNVTITSEKENGYDIDLMTDRLHQGIMASDGVFYNLNISDLKIRTQHKEGILINGMVSGSLNNIKLDGNSEIILNPIRLSGGNNNIEGTNIFIASPTDFPNFYQEIEGLNELIEEYPNRVYDFRKALDVPGSEEFEEFTSKYDNLTVYRNFPVEKLNYKYCNEENHDSGNPLYISHLVGMCSTIYDNTKECEKLYPNL